MKINKIYVLFLGLVLVFSLLPADPGTRAAEVTYTVKNTDDSGPDSLRWAINQANTHVGSGDTITVDFGLVDTDPNYDNDTGVWTITLDSALPVLIAGNTTIDGYTQEGAQYATASGSPILVVELSGSNIPPISDPPILVDLLKSGLNIASANNTVTGLLITHFPLHGIAIAGTTTTNNTIAGNYIGTSNQCAHDEGNDGFGVYIGLGAKNNLVGGDSPEAKNYLLYNGLDGVGIEGSNTTDNRLAGNHIMLNKIHGVRIYAGAHHNNVGGSTENERNIISGNERDGVRIQGSGTNDNIISGNYVGISPDGDLDLSNHDNGVQITLGAQENLIGGSTAGSGNLISGNVESGVLISGTNTISNTIAGNLIGTGSDGTGAIPNVDGIQIISGAQHNLVGGDSEIERNIISGNSGYGVWLSDADVSGNRIIGNFIGTNISGTQVISNTKSGVFIAFGAHDNTVGGDSSDERNLISGNGAFGVEIFWDAHHNTVSGNYIGTDVGGSMALGNSRYGVSINRSQDNVIGGDTQGTGNLISGNGESGVEIWHADATGNTVSGNLIGTGKDGRKPLPNSIGIEIKDGASDNIVGPGNIIANNSGDGVRVNHADSINNIITQNSIFSNDHGILLEEGANGGINPPVILSASDVGEVSGTTCGDCIVEVFWSHSPDGQGEVYLESTTANSAGEFNLTLPWRVDVNLTATATDPTRGTSTFSEVFRPRFISYLPISMKGE